jgi:hypothetical protein
MYVEVTMIPNIYAIAVVIINIVVNVGSYTQQQIAGDLAIAEFFDSCQSRLTGTERKDAHRKPLLPHLGS